MPKNSLLNLSLLVPSLMIFTACQTKPVQRSDKKKDSTNQGHVSSSPPPPSLPVGEASAAINTPSTKTTPTPEPDKTASPENPEESGEESTTKKQETKIGLILGGGAIRTYAHIGVLQEFSKRKIPIVAVGGIEMGSLVAAIYAMKAQPFEVEWQMMKLKEKDLLQKGLISSKNKILDVQSLDEFNNMVFAGFKAEQTKIPFTCPSLNIEQQKVYVLTKGSFKDMLPYCLAIPPLFRPFQQNIAGIFSLSVVADQLRAKGANFIIYVDALAAPVKSDSFDGDALSLWSLAAESSRQKSKNIDYVLQLPLRGFDLMDFSRRRELVQKGQQAALDAIKTLQKEIDL